MDRKHRYPGIRTTKKIGLARFLSRAHACLVGKRKAHYYFTVKGNQPSLLEGLEFYFQDRRQPHFVETTPADHGRIETRKIWTTTKLNGYLFLMWAKRSSSSGTARTKRAVRVLSKSVTASPAALRNKPDRNAFCGSTAATGPSRVATT